MTLKSEPNLGGEKGSKRSKKAKAKSWSRPKIKRRTSKKSLQYYWSRWCIFEYIGGIFKIKWFLFHEHFLRVDFLRSKPRFCLSFSLFKIESTFYARYWHLFSQNQGLYFTFNRLNFFKLLWSPFNFFAFDELLFSRSGPLF